MICAGLEARRLRRREKAAIVKDKTKAVVASAAEEGSRLRAKAKAKRRKARKEKGEKTSSSSEQPRRKKRKHSSTARDHAKRLREQHQRPSYITKGRLTVSSALHGLSFAVVSDEVRSIQLPPPQVGMFGNAVSSKRTKVAKGQAGTLSFKPSAALPAPANSPGFSSRFACQ